MRSAIVVPFPEAATFDGWRERTCEAKPSHGVPPHVTLLFPFAPAPVAEPLLAEIEEMATGIDAFAVSFGTLGRFPGALWLAPEPSEPFVRMALALAGRFPEWPAYEGAFAEPVPHLTVAQGTEALLDDAELELSQLLPLAAHAREVVVMEEREPARWRRRATFPLGEAS